MNYLKDLVVVNSIYFLVIPLVKLGDWFPENDISIISFVTFMFFVPGLGVLGNTFLGWFVGIVISVTAISVITIFVKRRRLQKGVFWTLIFVYFFCVFIFNALQVEWGAF
jgi:hypothetical protein